ncbi:hypothetical protein CerSpe_159140 [Prunus speciosa]
MVSSLVGQFVCFVFLVVVSISRVRAKQTVFDVTKNGGVADGKTDNSKAFTDAWTQACQKNGGGVILFPTGKYLVRPVILKGECKGPIGLQIEGTLLAPQGVQSSVDMDHWITFQHVDNLDINGGGLLDGQGPSAWHHNNCLKDAKCKRLPANLRFDFVTNLNIDHITSINSKNLHINLFACQDVKVTNVNISAPAESPNTDGIHIGSSSNIQILDSVIATGDDCISFSAGSSKINVSGVHCGPGHGMSIGSLGRGNNNNNVSFVDIRNCSFVGTDNGVRIKTWAPSKQGTVSHVYVENIRMDQVKNPIVIDQNYCPARRCSATESSQIQIVDVKMINIWGTSSTPNAVTLKCSETKPCQKIQLRDINLSYKGPDGPAVSACSKVDVITDGKQNPRACTKPVKQVPRNFDVLN